LGERGEEKPKLSAKQVVQKVLEAGFADFGMHQHTHGAKNPQKGYGTMVVNSWCWYHNWVTFIMSELTKEGEVKADAATV
jgi:hypothetical protein